MGWRRKAVGLEMLDESIYFALADTVPFRENRHDIGHLVALGEHSRVVRIQVHILGIFESDANLSEIIQQLPVKFQHVYYLHFQKNQYLCNRLTY